MVQFLTKVAMGRNEFTKEKINEYISIVELQTPKTPKDYYILRKFSVFLHPETNEKLLINNKDRFSSSLPAYYAPNNESDTHIDIAHRRIIHGGIKKTYAALKKNIINIKLASVKTFIEEKCEHCKIKRKNKKLKSRIPPITSPIISNKFGQRCQVDLIDFRKYDYANCSFVLNYQDNLTRFCILKPLTDKCADTIVNTLAEIFCMFGAPTILHTDNGGEFRNNSISRYVDRYWPSLKIIRGKPYNPRSQGAVERANKDVKEMLISIMSEKQQTDVRSVLNYVQYLKNTSVNRTIKCCPYKAVFGQDPVVHLASEHLTSPVYTFSNQVDEDDIEDEKEIEYLQSKCEDLMNERDKVRMNTITEAQKRISTLEV